MKVKAFSKVVHPGLQKVGSFLRPVFCKIEYSADGRLSITGVVGPTKSGNAFGGCGQINPVKIDQFEDEWTPAMLRAFNGIWKAWHLNDMKAGCEHQRAERWDERPIDPSKPLDSYGTHFEGQRHASWNMLAWIPRKDHPEGLLGHPCPVCGYKYGTAWMREEVPIDALAMLQNFPESSRTPALV